MGLPQSLAKPWKTLTHGLQCLLVFMVLKAFGYRAWGEVRDQYSERLKGYSLEWYSPSSAFGGFLGRLGYSLNPKPFYTAL